MSALPSTPPRCEMRSRSSMVAGATRWRRCWLTIAELAERKRYETAARLRDHAAATIDVLWRGQRLRALASIPEMVAAKPDGDRGWHLAVIRRGQLAAGRSRSPRGTANACRRRPQRQRAVDPADGRILDRPAVRVVPAGRRASRETALLTRWLVQPEVRIVRTEAGYCSPLSAAGRWLHWAASARSARHASHQLTEQLATSELLCERTQRASSSSAPPESIASVTRAKPGLPGRDPLGVAG